MAEVRHMFLGPEYDEFAAPLRGKTASQIRKLAESEQIRLPVIPDRELLIQELYAIKKGLPSPIDARNVPMPKMGGSKDAGSPAAKPVDDLLPSDAAAGESAPIKPSRSVRCRREAYWRCGRCWGPKKVSVALDEFTDAQWETLCADANLMIRDEV